MEPIPTNTAYFYELSLLDNFSEFHSDWFSELTASEHADLVSYYGWGVDLDSVLAWRDEHVASDSALSTRAPAALARILGPYGISLAQPS